MKEKRLSKRNLAAGLALALLCASMLPAAADMRDDILDNAKRCNAIADDQHWLDCYYGVAQPMRAKLGLVPAPQSQQRMLPSQRANTGLVASILGEAQMADISATLSAYSFNSSGLFTVTLSNGQVWVQSPNDEKRARWSRPAGTMTVKISPGAFGTFNMVIEGQGQAYKVKRLH